MHARWVIGLASGSSALGVDASLLELEGLGLDVRLRQAFPLHQPHSAELRGLLSRVEGSPPLEIAQVSRLHRLLGETFAAAARAVADHASLSLQKVFCIGCGGQLVCHDTEGRFPSTLSLGMPAVIAERCGVTTVSDFPARDVAAGGLGGPLSVLPDHLLFRHARESRLLVHLGATARLVYLPSGGRVQEAFGFDAGPCNELLDALMRHLTAGRETYDAGGKRAVQGHCLEPVVQSWLNHPTLQRRPPRALPRHTFGDAFASQAILDVRLQGGGPHDLLCTATHFVARGVSQAVRRFLHPRPIDRVFLSGGGVRNGLLWHLLEQQFVGLPLARTDEAGVPAEGRKAIEAGLLAALTFDGVPGNAPAATGAAGSRLLGSLVPGSSANWARCLLWMAQTSAEWLRVNPE